MAVDLTRLRHREVADPGYAEVYHYHRRPGGKNAHQVMHREGWVMAFMDAEHKARFTVDALNEKIVRDRILAAGEGREGWPEGES